jgi:hypothetical protein
MAHLAGPKRVVHDESASGRPHQMEVSWLPPRARVIRRRPRSEVPPQTPCSIRLSNA